ncbi:MAG: esterase family protein [Clostridia bacterium]|nr:esterase family protein [Clostridia bacterium]
MASFDIRFLSGKLMRKTAVTLIIPSLDLHGALSAPGGYYMKREEKFPLAVMLSGFGDDGKAWEQRADVAELCDRYRVAAALIGGENKWYLNLSPVDDWAGYIAEELPDFIGGNFSAVDVKRRIICGVSMGGYGALGNCLARPQDYMAAAALSPALKPDDYVKKDSYVPLEDVFLAAKENLPYTYISYGDKDFVYADAVKLDAWLEENVPGVRVRIVPGYGHAWDLWRLEIRNFLDSLKSKNII